MHVRSTSAIDDFPEVTSSLDTSEFIQVTKSLDFFSIDYSFEYYPTKPFSVIIRVVCTGTSQGYITYDPDASLYEVPLHTVYLYTVYLFAQGRGGGEPKINT
jgi:hypothetical protein